MVFLFNFGADDGRRDKQTAATVWLSARRMRRFLNPKGPFGASHQETDESTYEKHMTEIHRCSSVSGCCITANVPGTKPGRAGENSSEHPPVRIDETGIHVGGPNPVDIKVPAWARQRKELALEQLQSGERAAVVLCCQHGLTHEEAAEALDCPLGTVRTNVLRGKERLKRRLPGYQHYETA